MQNKRCLGYLKFTTDLSRNGPNDAQGFPHEIRSQYDIKRILGKGEYGEVRLVHHKQTGHERAMKIVKRNETDKPESEAHIMNALQHPCVIRMHDIVDKPDSVYMVLELMRGGDLHSRIVKNQRLPENTSKLFFYQMCHAIRYLHNKGIAHRDIKANNVLLETEDEETLIKIADFGLSESNPNGGQESYTKKGDIWSLGLVLRECLTGTLSDDHPTWEEVSPLPKSLIEKMVTPDPKQAPSIDYVLNHEWLCDPEIIEKANILMKPNTLWRRIIWSLQQNVHANKFFDFLTRLRISYSD